MIEQGQPDDLNWSIGSLAGAGMLGDWYVMVSRVYSLDHIYEVHFVATHKGA
jgi:hypothetical protein